jgi:hypothetical protein
LTRAEFGKADALVDRGLGRILDDDRLLRLFDVDVFDRQNRRLKAAQT